MEIHWKTSLDLSAMHAAWCLSSYASACRADSQNLKAAAADLSEGASRLNLPAGRYWELLMVLSVDSPSNKDLAERLMIRSLPAAARSPTLQSWLTAAIATMESSFRREFPQFQADMRLRTEPLKQQWEAYGPGLLRLIANRTNTELLAEAAEVILVQPIVGGAGFTHLATNRCHVEAVLTNSQPQLPEVLRLAWLLAQLELDRPVYSDRINAFRLPRIGGMAMLPPALLAAEELDLGHFTVDTLQTALEAWRLTVPGQPPAAAAQVVMAWWETVQVGEPEWSIALAGLDRMLGD